MFCEKSVFPKSLTIQPATPRGAGVFWEYSCEGIWSDVPPVGSGRSAGSAVTATIGIGWGDSGPGSAIFRNPLDTPGVSGYSVRTVPRGRAEATLPPDTRLERRSIAGYSDATWVTRDRRERAHCCGACARKRLVRERGGSGVGRDCFFFPGDRVAYQADAVFTPSILAGPPVLAHSYVPRG